MQPWNKAETKRVVEFVTKEECIATEIVAEMCMLKQPLMKVTCGKRFQEGKISAEDKQHSGIPLLYHSVVQNMMDNMICTEWHNTVNEIIGELVRNCSHIVIRQIIQTLDTRKYVTEGILIN